MPKGVNVMVVWAVAHNDKRDIDLRLSRGRTGEA